MFKIKPFRNTLPMWVLPKNREGKYILRDGHHRLEAIKIIEESRRKEVTKVDDINKWLIPCQVKTAGEIESQSATTAATVWFSTLEELGRDRSLFRSKDSLIQLRKAKTLEKLGHGLVHKITYSSIANHKL